MAIAVHRAPSVGSIVQKLLAINPALTTTQLIAIIKQATVAQGRQAGEFSGTEVVDETRAVALAQLSLKDN